MPQERKYRYNEYRREWRRRNPEKMAAERRRGRERARVTGRAYYLRNREKILAECAARRKANPDIQRNSILLKKFGISLNDKEQMYKDQRGLCKLCGNPLPKDFRRAHTDHNHETGKVRGLLDAECNKFLGYLECNKTLLKAAYTYLEWSLA